MKWNSPKHKLNAKKSCRIFCSSICKTTNAGTVLQFFHQTLWLKQVRKIEKGHRLAVACPCLDGTGRLYPTRNETEWERLRPKDCNKSFTVAASGNFFLGMCSDKQKKTWQGSLDSSKKRSGVQGCCFYAARRFASMLLTRTNKYLAAETSTNLC